MNTFAFVCRKSCKSVESVCLSRLGPHSVRAGLVKPDSAECTCSLILVRMEASAGTASGNLWPYFTSKVLSCSRKTFQINVHSPILLKAVDGKQLATLCSL